MRSGAVTIIGALFVPILAAWAADEPQRDAAPPTFVFTGKVKALRQSNEPSVKGSDHTVIVTVQEIQAPAPPILGDYKGRDITVKTTKSLADSPLAAGQVAVFTTQGLVYGSGVVVREVAERRLIGEGDGAADPEKGLVAAPVTEVVGTVQEVHPVPHEKLMTALAQPVTKKRFPREHDPKWHEAVVEVQSAEGEAKGQKHVVVVFPQSDDIAWRHAPKFRRGDKGTFRLHKGQIRNPAMAKALLNTPTAESPTQAAYYTALNPGDFTPRP